MTAEPVQRGLSSLPEPEKIYFRIGEVAKLLDLPAYVLRYWETEFPELHPRKTTSGRRIYNRTDIALLRELKRLRHEKGYTIKGVRKALSRKKGNRTGLLLRTLRSDLERLRDKLERPALPPDGSR